MGWAVRFDRRAEKELRALDAAVAKRIVRFVRVRLGDAPNPRAIGTPLKGNHAGLWRWRVGDYRLIGDIRDAELRIMLISVGDRREIYG